MVMNPNLQNQSQVYPAIHPQHGQTIVVPTDHDVLCGRGVNIAQHSGNERFRALVNSRYDKEYCHSYTTLEKRAVAEDIISHLKNLSPPGRFLRRPGRSKNSRGLEGPWEELTEKEAIKKTCQALRDCNRQDRTGYAATVNKPIDVQFYEQVRSQSGMSNKELARQAAEKVKREAAEVSERLGKRPLPPDGSISATVSTSWESVSPTVENAAEWLKKQKTSHAESTYKTPVPNPSTTPTTAASSSGMLNDTSMLSSYSSNTPSTDHIYQITQEQSHSSQSGSNMAPSPAPGVSFGDPFQEDDYTKLSMKHPGFEFNSNDLDPLYMAAEAAASMEGGHRFQPSLSSLGIDHGSIDMHNYMQSNHNDSSFLHANGMDGADYSHQSLLHSDDQGRQGGLSDDQSF